MASISKRDVGGKLRFDVRFRDPDGRARRKTFSRMTDARAFAAAIEADKLRGTYLDLDAGRETFKAYAERWLRHSSRDPQTYSIRERILRLHVYPELGDVELRKITGTTMRGLIASLDVADKYAVDIFGVVSSVLSAAVDDKLIASNPAKAASVRRMKPRTPRRKVTPWPIEWVEAMHEGLPERYKIIVTIGAGLGLRQGEIFGLAVEDVDFLRGIVLVRRQVKLVGKRQTFAPAKARKDDDAPREIPLPESVRAELAAHLQRFPAKRVTLPWRDPENGKPTTVHLIVTTRNDKPLDRLLFNSRSWPTARRKAEIPASRENGTHALRHWYASTLLEAGVSIRAVSDYLGHADPGFTLRTYTHLMPSGEERPREAVDARFARADTMTGLDTDAQDTTDVPPSVMDVSSQH